MSYVTHIFIAFIFLLSVSFAQSNINDPENNIEVDNKASCLIPTDEQILNSSWFDWRPYQFMGINPKNNIRELTGMDIAIIKAIASKIGIKINNNNLDLLTALNKIKEGSLDMSSGITYSPQRERYLYYSEPYRFEENSIFVLNKSNWKLNFQNIGEFLAQIRLQNFRLGVGKGFVYSDDKINDFIDDASNNDIVFQYLNERTALDALLKGEIDGFIGDKISASLAILNKRVIGEVSEYPLNISSSVHLVFSKKCVSLAIVNTFNEEIKKFVKSSEYKNILKAYLYPIIALNTAHSSWFYAICMIGTIAFTVSALAIGVRENTTLTASLIFACIPSIGIGILRDVIITPYNGQVIFSSIYLLCTIIIVVIGFAAIRLLNYYNQNSSEDQILQSFWFNLENLTDALGSSCFMFTGIAIVIIKQINPIELWGPFFAFLTSHLGVMIRELFRQKISFANMFNEVNFEVTIFWSFIFCLLLKTRAISIDSENIKVTIIVIILCTFVTKLAARYFKCSNIKFKSNSKSTS